MDDQLIGDALRSDSAPPPHPFFRFDVMRRIRAKPPLAFPWRIVAVAIVLGGVVGAFFHGPSLALNATTLIPGTLIFAFVVRGVSESV